MPEQDEVRSSTTATEVARSVGRLRIMLPVGVKCLVTLADLVVAVDEELKQIETFLLGPAAEQARAYGEPA